MLLPESETSVNSVECDQAHGAPLPDSFQTFVYSVFMPAVCIPGVLGACICIIVFTKKQMRSSLNIYLAGLSVFDLVLLTMSLLIYPLLSACIQQVNFFSALKPMTQSILGQQRCCMSYLLAILIIHISHVTYCSNRLSMDMCGNYGGSILSRKVPPSHATMVHSPQGILCFELHYRN